MKGILSGNISRYRKAKNLTQEELGTKLHVSFQAVSKWETGAAMPDAAVFPSLAELLGVSVDKLMGYTAFGADKTIYDERYNSENYYWGTAPGEMCLKVLQFIPPTKRLKLLDIGCGEGKDAVFLARCGYDVTAFDISEVGIEKARKLAEKAGVDVKIFKANINDYRLDEKYDILYSTGVFHYIKPELRREIIENYKSSVNKDGFVALQTFVVKPFIDKAPDSEECDCDWLSGELAGYFHDWCIEECPEYVFDCASSGVPHKHVANKVFARKVVE
jgi:tellurite methyltransferase